MPAKRLPNSIARITGAAARNPARFAGRADPKVEALGPAPASLSPAQAAIWDELAADFPWCARSDRRIVGLACQLQSLIDDPDVPTTPSLVAQMRLVLQSMGGTPTDRSRVNAPDDDSDDPATEFVQ